MTGPLVRCCPELPLLVLALVLLLFGTVVGMFMNGCLPIKIRAYIYLYMDVHAYHRAWHGRSHTVASASYASDARLETPPVPTHR